MWGGIQKRRERTQGHGRHYTVCYVAPQICSSLLKLMMFALIRFYSVFLILFLNAENW